MAQDYTPIWDDWLEVTRELNAEEKGRLIDAIVAYKQHGDWQTAIQGNERFVFPTYQVRLDRWFEVSDIRSKNGSAGGRLRKNKEKQGKANKSKNREEKEEEQEEEENVLDTAFGPVELDEDWARVEDSYAEQIGELPFGMHLDKLRGLYEDLGADVVITAIEATNEAQPNNPRSYLISILEKWQKKGIHTAAEAKGMVTEHRRVNGERKKPEPVEMPAAVDDVRWV